MSGLLLHAPTDAERERVYHELALLGVPAVGTKRRWPYRPATREALLVLAAEMVRYDSRLLSILVQLLLRRFRDFNPVIVREEMRAMRWPQSLLVVLEFAAAASTDPELRHYAQYLRAGWPRIAPAERFFIDAERPGSRMAARNLGRNLEPYARWGFIGNERPVVDPITKRSIGRYDAETRRRILRELASAKPVISLSEYLDAVDHAISRQQATLDLKRCSALSPAGRGRGAVWKTRRARASPAGA